MATPAQRQVRAQATLALVPVSPPTSSRPHGKQQPPQRQATKLQRQAQFIQQQQQQQQRHHQDSPAVTRAVSSLIQSAGSESRTLVATLRIAEELFTRIVIEGQNARNRNAVGGAARHRGCASNNGSTMAATSFGGASAGGGGDAFLLSGSASSVASGADASADGAAVAGGGEAGVFDIGHSRVAVSCLFLERLCAVFPRYNAAVRPIAEAIVRSIFVPDTHVTRELVGNLDCPIVVDDSVPPEVVELLRPYARKTYAAAFSRISTMLKRYSKTSHSLEVRLKRQAQVFERTLAHWRKTLLRSVFVAWRSTIRRRIFLRAKYRAIFTRLREDECRARAIRLWHQRAARLRKAALADAAMQQEMSKLHVTSDSLQQQIAALLEQNATLSRDVADLERQRQLLQQEMQDRDRFVVDMNHRTSEAERLGTELLDSVLLKQDPPPGATPIECLVRWGHEVIEVHGGSVDGATQPLSGLLSDESVLPDFSFAALGTILSAFAVDGAPPREAILQMHISPDTAPQLLIHFYGRVTQRPSMVDESHLRSKQRGVLLLFLASLMRFASSWMFGPPPLNLRDKLRKKAEAAAAGRGGGGGGGGGIIATVGGGGGGAASSAGGLSSSSGAATPAPKPSSSTWMERVRTQQRWVVVSLSAMNAALLIASDRPQVLSAEEQEDEEKYCALTASMLEDLVPSSQLEERLAHIHKCVRNAFPDIRKLYLTYSSPTMSLEECWRLLKDGRLAGAAPEQITKRKMYSLISMIRRLVAAASSSSAASSPTANQQQLQQQHSQHHQGGSSSAAAAGGAAGAGGGGGVVDISPMQFMILLLHVSLFEHRRSMRLDNPESVYFEAFMLENATRLLRDNALRTDVDQFRHMVRHPLVQTVISRHKVSMRRAFRKFANCEEGESMNRNAFHAMARACGWLTRTVNIETLNDIFRRVQRTAEEHEQQSTAAGGGAAAGVSGETIDLSEWIECLCAIATFTYPNPFKPLHEKMAVFVEERVIPII